MYVQFYLYVYVSINTDIYIYIYVDIFCIYILYIYICIYTYIYIYICVCVFITYMYIYICACVHMCIYIYTYVPVHFYIWACVGSFAGHAVWSQDATMRCHARMQKAQAFALSLQHGSPCLSMALPVPLKARKDFMARLLLVEEISVSSPEKSEKAKSLWPSFM